MTETEKDYQRIAKEKWEKKRKDCPNHPTDAFSGRKIISKCGESNSCAFESCPFVYWDCL